MELSTVMVRVSTLAFPRRSPFDVDGSPAAVRGRQGPMLDASLNEVGIVVLFVGVVLLASKVGKIGEAIGGWFERGDGTSPASEAKGDTSERP
jgi:hypothetical protein